MKVHEITAIALRIFAVVLFIFVLDQALSVLSYRESIDEDTPAYLKLYIVASVLVPLLIAVVIWIFPITIARKILPFSAEKEFTPLAKNDLYTLAIVSIGIYLLSQAIPDIIYWITRYFITINMRAEGLMMDFGTQFISGVSATVVELMIGIWLVFGSSGLLRLLRRARQWD